MNIFYLDEDPYKAAQLLHDQHIVKMCLESAQLLCNAVRLKGFPVADITYKLSHHNHPCSIWVRASSANYQWLYEHCYAINKEYKFRYDKQNDHRSWLVAKAQIMPQLPDIPFFAPPQVMPEEYKVPGNSVLAYQRYYAGKKMAGKLWTKRTIPEFVLQENAA